MRVLRRVDSMVWLGVVTIAVTAGFVVAAFTGTFGKLVAPSTHSVKAVFASTQQLRVGNTVRIDGVDVGKVSAMKLDPGARTATATLALEHSAGPLYRDARASVRWKLLLGGAFYVALDRGTPSAGPLGDTAIPAAHTSNQVELDDVVSVDQGGARRGLQTMPGELAKALRDSRPPARALGVLSQVAPSVAKGVGAVRGVDTDRDLRALVSASASTVRALDENPVDVQALVAGAAATLDTTAARQADLQATFARAPGVMDNTDVTLSRLDTTLHLADPLIAKLQGPAGQVAPTIAQLRPTVTGADRLLNNAVPLFHALRPAVRSIAATARQGVPLVDGLTPSLDRLDQTILPYLNVKDPDSQHTTAQMIGPTTAALGPNIAGQVDDNGRFIRFPATGGNDPLYLPCQEWFSNPDATKLVTCETLAQAMKSFFDYNPLAPPKGVQPGGSKP